MSKQSLLLVDGDTRSLRVLEVSLRKAGFSVTPAVSVSDALDKLEVNAPDLIISETKFATDLDGFELRRRLRTSPEWEEIPFIFLTAETAIESKIKGLELGVDDYLTKPIYIKEIVTRINILLQKRQRQFLDLKKDGTRFAGRVTDMPVVDVIQTIEVSRKSGVIQFSNGPTRTATIYFRDGRVIDAEAGTLQGEDAVYRLLTWNEGEFEVEFRTVRRREVISTSSQGLLMEGMRRLDEWSRLLEQLPPLSHRFEIDTVELSGRLGEIPDDNNRILRLFDGRRTLLEVIDGSDFGDLECLQAISRLYFEGLLIDLDPGVRSRRDSGKSGPHLLVESPPVTPIEEVVSGPIDIAGLEARLARKDSATSTAVADAMPVTTTTAEPLRRDSGERARRDSGERARRDSAQAIDESSIVAEEEIRGPLSGGYRPSSLRLIDEAVAAAEAIEPSLFDSTDLEALGLNLDVPGLDPTPSEKSEPARESPAAVARVKIEKRLPDPRIENARDLIEKTPAIDRPKQNERVGANGDLRDAPRAKKPSPPPPLPTVAEPPVQAAAQGETADESSGVPTPIGAEPAPTVTSEPAQRTTGAQVRRDDSQPYRMVGSQGRDRAEASGEVRAPVRASSAAETEPQRELVTILPRRITREIAVQTPDGEGAKDETQQEAQATGADAATPAVESPVQPEPRRIAVTGSGTRRSHGPGRLAQSLIAIAVALVGMTTYTYMKKRRQNPVVVPTARDAAVAIAIPDAVPVAVVPDAALAMEVTDDAAVASHDGAIAMTSADAALRHDASVAVARPDAAVVAMRPDAATGPRPDAAMVAATTGDAGVDKSKEAKALFDKGHSALEDGDPDQALELLDQSLKVKRTPRTLLERARALQRLNRVDDAVASIDEAIGMSKNYAQAFQQKGMLLWSAQRYSEARPPLEKYLELQPDGRDADKIRGMLEEQK